MAWGRQSYKFVETEGVIDAVRAAEPTYDFVGDVDRTYPPSSIHQGRKVTWIGSKGYLVSVPAKNVLFMEGNQWNLGHAAALVERIRSGEGDILAVPAGRIYRITAREIAMSEKYERQGELEYQLGMTEPWTKAERGEYYAQLLDGNHRAAAALVVGEPYIYVYVAENTRENVYKKDFE